MKIQEHISLGVHTTLGVGGEARYFVIVDTIEELCEAISFAGEKDQKIMVLGEGANILVSDNGFEGLVIHLNIKETSFEQGSEDVVVASVGAGALWDDFVLSCVEKNLRGLESTSGIPGSVGAAVVGNIAAYGQAVSDTLEHVEVIDINSKDLHIELLRASEMGLNYRYSDFQNEKLSSKIIISGAFRLDKKTPPKLEYESALKVVRELNLNIENISEHRRAILEARNRAGSLLYSNDEKTKTAGSFFRNPEVPAELAEVILSHEEFGVTKGAILKQNQIHGGKAMRVSAAHVLLAAGFQRGQTWGNVRLHPKHILKIENTGNATAQNIYDVSKEIISTVKNKFNIELEPEVRFVGF